MVPRQGKVGRGIAHKLQQGERGRRKEERGVSHCFVFDIIVLICIRQIFPPH